MKSEGEQEPVFILKTVEQTGVEDNYYLYPDGYCVQYFAKLAVIGPSIEGLYRLRWNEQGEKMKEELDDDKWWDSWNTFEWDQFDGLLQKITIEEARDAAKQLGFKFS